MGEALEHSGRPMVYSLCQYGLTDVWTWGTKVGGNLWRTTGDIRDTWDSMDKIGFSQIAISSYTRPGHWNDPDMLEIGNGGMNADEYRTHMSLWSMLAAPLIAGNDLRTMSDETKSILMNKEVIAIDQDPLGKQGKRAYSDGEVEVWTRELQGGALAIAVINVGSDRNSTHPFHLDLGKLGLQGPETGKDLWTGKEVTLTDKMPIELPSHDILLVRVNQPK